MTYSIQINDFTPFPSQQVPFTSAPSKLRDSTIEVFSHFTYATLNQLKPIDFQLFAHLKVVEKQARDCLLFKTFKTIEDLCSDLADKTYRYAGFAMVILVTGVCLSPPLSSLYVVTLTPIVVNFLGASVVCKVTSLFINSLSELALTASFSRLLSKSNETALKNLSQWKALRAKNDRKDWVCLYNKMSDCLTQTLFPQETPDSTLQLMIEQLRKNLKNMESSEEILTAILKEPQLRLTQRYLKFLDLGLQDFIG